MIGTIRKHQTWLWAIIITVTIISFVVFFSPYSKLNPTRGPAQFGSLSGERISEEEFAQTEREIYLRTFFMTGEWPESGKKGFDPIRETYQWLFLVRKQRDLGFAISEQTLADAAREMVTRFDSRANPDVLVQKLLEAHRFAMDDFQRYVRHLVGLQQLISTVALGGKLVTPQEAKGLYVREHEELATEAVFFSASNYLDKVTATPEAILTFYSNNIANYRIPERVQVSYVKFDFTNFLAEAEKELAKMTNLNQQVEEAYRQNPTNLLRELKVQSLDEAKEKYRELSRKRLEAPRALEKAREFGRELYDRYEKEPRPDVLQVVAKEKGLPIQVSAPFDLKNGPKELEVGPSFAEAAFALTPTNEPFSRPIIGDDAIYIIGYEKIIPSEVPPLEQLRERVTADYKYREAVTQARAAGAEFAQKLNTDLAAGKTFAAVCEEAKVKLMELPPFSLSTRSMTNIEDLISLDGRFGLKELAFSTPPGKVSQFQLTRDGGLILHVKSKLPMDQEKLSKELPAFVNYVRQSRQNEAFNTWFNREAKRSGLDALLARPEDRVGRAAKKS